jgi:hypothetical protein
MTAEETEPHKYATSIIPAIVNVMNGFPQSAVLR